MSIERGRAYFAQFGMEDQVIEFNVSSATVELAAAALNCEPQRIAKTLSFLVDGQAILIVAAGDARIDNPKYKTIWEEEKNNMRRQIVGYRSDWWYNL